MKVERIGRYEVGSHPCNSLGWEITPESEKEKEALKNVFEDYLQKYPRCIYTEEGIKGGRAYIRYIVKECYTKNPYGMPLCGGMPEGSGKVFHAFLSLLTRFDIRLKA
jgi:hypothetical protein